MEEGREGERFLGKKVLVFWGLDLGFWGCGDIIICLFIGWGLR